MEAYHLCPKFEQAFALLGKRWTGLIIRILMDGPKRFSEIADAATNLSDRLLTERLKDLEENGIVVRHVYPDKPVRIVYSLTERGQALKPVMDEIQVWAETHHD
ncbi:MAG: helix-turn-helix domain-containing protein [Eubacteriales bacterium]|nr:helix-turn-helix domain-containing protein [Eubacteriales bacterium]